jgi:peptidoglycan/xylan/chitin deacetylase (PgdA/CDA1 family)
MRLFRPFFIAGCFYPEALFRIKTAEKQLCLTFDDGPHPESTPEVVEILNKYEVKAIFFCNGRAAEKYPHLVDLIKSKGHMIGNHGYSHLNGWRTSVKRYIADAENGARHTSSYLFRPPYGRLRLGQYRQLKRKYKIFFWDVMPFDFDKSFLPSESYNIALGKIRPGSVIVLHDQPFSSFIPDLQQFIEAAIHRGYSFVLPESFI